MNIEVLSGNFSAVDLREEPCYTEPPEKGKYGGKTQYEQQNVKWRAAEEQGDFASGSAQSPFSPRCCWLRQVGHLVDLVELKA